MSKDMMTVADMVADLGDRVTQQTVTRLLRSGAIEGAGKIGRKWLISREDWDGYKQRSGLGQRREQHGEQES